MTCDLAEATVSLAGQPGATPTRNDSINTFAFRDTNDINHFILGKDIGNLPLLLEQPFDVVYLLLNRAAIHLDLLDMRLLQAELHLADLRVADRTDHMTIFLCPFDFGIHRLLRSFLRLAPFLLILSECLVLGLVPVLVEASLAFVAQVTSPDASQGPQTTRCLDVAHKANHNHWWRL